MIMLALGMCFWYERNEIFWTSKVLQTNRNFQTGEIQMQVSLVLDKTVCIMLIRFQDHEANPVLLEFVLGLQGFYCPIWDRTTFADACLELSVLMGHASCPKSSLF